MEALLPKCKYEKDLSEKCKNYIENLKTTPFCIHCLEQSFSSALLIRKRLHYSHLRVLHLSINQFPGIGINNARAYPRFRLLRFIPMFSSTISQDLFLVAPNDAGVLNQSRMLTHDRKTSPYLSCKTLKLDPLKSQLW